MTDPYDPYRQADPNRQSDPNRPSDPYQASDPYQPSDPYQMSDPYGASPPPASPPLSASPPPYGAPPISGTPATAPLPTPYATSPAGYAGAGAGGYAYDPMTGQPLSDKSKVVAGTLQLVLGLVFTLGGVGRLYAGHIGVGVAQILASVVAWSAFWCGIVLAFPFAIWGGIWLWFIIDGILMLAGRPVDGQGRLLRS